jgi:hypothetical protein
MFWSKCNACKRTIEKEKDSISIVIRERRLSYVNRIGYEVCKDCFNKINQIIQPERLSEKTPVGDAIV